MKKCKLMYLIAAAALLTACSSELEEQLKDNVPITLGYNIAEVDTRAPAATAALNNDYLASGEVVKVLIKPSGGSYTGYDYTTGAAGVMTPPSPAPEYPEGSTVDILSFYPSAIYDGSSDEINFTVSTNQSAVGDPNGADDAARGYKGSDLMWATPVIDQARTYRPVNLQFRHLLSKITVNATAGSGVTSITSVKLKNVKPTVTFNQKTGKISAASGDVVDIQMLNEGSALIPPQTINSAFIEIEADGQIATYTLNSKSFFSGRAYTLDITVNSAALGLTNTITGWGGPENTVGIAGLTDPLTIDAIDDQEYTGLAIEPVPTVTCNGSTVDPADYDVYWVDNIYPGAATVAIAGKDGTAYAGMYAAREFTINNVPLGSLYFEDGTVATTNPGNKTVIGIVVYRNEGRTNDDAITEKDAGYGHGLVMALNNVGEYQWALVQIDEDNSLFPNVNSADAMAADFRGFAKTNYLGDNSNYPAFYHAKRYTPVSTSTAINSGWFLASGGQWLAILGPNGLGADNNVTTLTWETACNGSQLCLTNLNDALSVVSGSTLFSTDYFGYATSSEHLYNHGVAFFFNYQVVGLRIGGIIKATSNERVVRPILAF